MPKKIAYCLFCLKIMQQKFTSQKVEHNFVFLQTILGFEDTDDICLFIGINLQVCG